MQTATVPTPFGPVTITAQDNYITNLTFSQSVSPSSASPTVNCSLLPVHAPLAHAVAQLNEYLAGTRQTFDLLLKLTGTAFQRDVWRRCAAIPYGETITYGQLAADIDRPKAVRAVGAALGANPVAVFVPCHRVVGADGSLTGFAGGLDAKKWLLAHEQVHVNKG